MVKLISANANPLDLFDQPLLLDMIFLGTPQLCGGVYILFVFKVSFEKHPNHHLADPLSDLQAHIGLCHHLNDNHQPQIALFASS